ncbi:MAG TPA: hypothetical protein VFU32_09170 [Ktedonobacterales bacterium]|nr:hypothetical protein [Ktedonobacterales bacterium]
MSQAHRTLGSSPTTARKEPWWMEVCRSGRHAWEVTAVVGLFVCGRCGVVGACGHYAGRLEQVERVVCGAWCQRAHQEQGAR